MRSLGWLSRTSDSAKTSILNPDSDEPAGSRHGKHRLYRYKFIVKINVEGGRGAERGGESMGLLSSLKKTSTVVRWWRRGHVCLCGAVVPWLAGPVANGCMQV